jgi:hypothetical protein
MLPLLGFPICNGFMIDARKCLTFKCLQGIILKALPSIVGILFGTIMLWDRHNAFETCINNASDIFIMI